ncbi:hypothetical protein [Microbacterium azadirachtae]|uniref:Alpha/beta hydrolase family protein n=1 Tax=Microbacterium azadirachtae TaxID=582680 RepID=A0A0F0LNR0_9MICO|nr:hypothetical protein [Microbacterium azadirachtae]KJL33905.1 Alpha/beta hydrolase family protein [Microbacterium azadirachtae]
MADDVEITHGGMIAVDPDRLRTTAGRVRAEAGEVACARQDLLAIPGLVDDVPLARGFPALWSAAARLQNVEDALERLAGGVGTMADVYELADLRARQAMLGAGDVAAARDLRRREERLLAGDARLSALDERLQESWRRGVAEGFAPGGEPGSLPGAAGDALLLGLSPALFLLQSVLGWNTRVQAEGAQRLMTSVAAENGVVRPAPLAPAPGLVLMADARSPAGVRPRAGDVVIDRGPAATIPAGPSTLAGAVSRIPFGRSSQVRVETYRMGDGAQRFVAYIDGTRGRSAEEPWSFASNLRMYSEHAEADSYRAVAEALRDAGAGADTPVDLVGYSQGGMIAGLLAQSGEFDVQGVVTVGSPIEPVLPDDVLSVAVRHTDDPVAGLAGGGSPNGTGSPDSLVIRRTVAPGHGTDPQIPAHLLDGYAETVRRAEASGDERMARIAEHFAVLDTATSMTSTDYTARRVTG